MDLTEGSVEILTWVIGGTLLTFLVFAFTDFGMRVAKSILSAIGGMF